MFQAALVVQEPFRQRGVPSVGQARSGRLHSRHAAHLAVRARETVAFQLQPPLPAAVPGRGDKTAPIELGGPLLTGIARLPAVYDGHEGMPPRLIRGADAGPIGFGQSFRHLVGRGELLGLAGGIG